MVSVEEFLGKFKKKKTNSAYRRTLKHFGTFLGVDLDHYFDAYRQEESQRKREDLIDGIQNDISRWLENLRTVGYVDWNGNKKPYSPKAIQQHAGCIQSFLKANRASFTDSFWKDAKINGEAKTKDRIPSKDEIKRIMTHLDLLGKTFFFVMLSTGIRLGDILKIKIKDIDFTPKPTIIHYHCSKLGKNLVCFLTTEASQAVQSWINAKEERDKICKNAYKFNNKKSGQTIEEFRAQRNNQDLLFPLASTHIYTRFKKALKLAGLDQRDEDTGNYILHPHSLGRKYFKSITGTVLTDGVTEQLIGHACGLNKVYRMLSTEQLAEEFLKAEDILTLTVEILPSGELDAVKERLEKNGEKLNTIAQENKILTKSNSDHFKIIQQLLEKIDVLQAEVDHRNEILAKQVDYQWQQKMEQETPKPDINKLKQGADCIIAKMRTSGRSPEEIQAYKRTIEMRMEQV